MKARINYYNVQCCTCGSGLIGEQHWFEAPSIIVECMNPNCEARGKKWKLPIQRIELEPAELDLSPPY